MAPSGSEHISVSRYFFYSQLPFYLVPRKALFWCPRDIRLSLTVSPKFIATSLLSGLPLKLVSFWDCLCLEVSTGNMEALETNFLPGCGPTSSLTPSLTTPGLCGPPSSEHLDSFIHSFIHPFNGYLLHTHPLLWTRGGKNTSLQRVHNLMEEPDTNRQ